jgi:predicted flap endonuclease-1-like 5' DNA nuclease
MRKLMDLDGIGEEYAQKLRAAGINTPRDLLARGATAQGRRAIAEKSSISEKLILEWVNHVDLFRIEGVGRQYADLLEESGVDTVVELAQRNPENLYQKLCRINEEKKLVRRLPRETELRGWIEQASRLPGLVSY